MVSLDVFLSILSSATTCEDLIESFLFQWIKEKHVVMYLKLNADNDVVSLPYFIKLITTRIENIKIRMCWITSIHIQIIVIWDTHNH